MGLHVVVSDGNAEAPGLSHADDAIIASTYGIEETIAAAYKYRREVRPIHGVTSIAADVPLTVARFAEALELPGIPVGAAELAPDKLRMKECFVEAGIPVPWFSDVESPDHLASILAERDTDMVIKPVDSRGARGVLRIGPGADIWEAFERAFSQSPAGRVMIEEFLSGPQLSTESVLIRGQGYTPGLTDRNYEYLDRFAPYIIENGGQQPSELNERQQKEISSMAERAGIAMGISTGIAKGDMVYTPEGPRVIEIAARLSGGWFSSDQVPLATGVDLIGVAIKLALGDDVPGEEVTPKYQKGVCIRYFFPAPGRVREIRNREQVERRPWVHRLGFFVQPGGLLEPVTNHTQRAGFVITVGDTRDEAVARAQEVVQTIEIITE